MAGRLANCRRCINQHRKLIGPKIGNAHCSFPLTQMKKASLCWHLLPMVAWEISIVVFCQPLQSPFLTVWCLGVQEMALVKSWPHNQCESIKRKEADSRTSEHQTLFTLVKSSVLKTELAFLTKFSSLLHHHAISYPLLVYRRSVCFWTLRFLLISNI